MGISHKEARQIFYDKCLTEGMRDGEEMFILWQAGIIEHGMNEFFRLLERYKIGIETGSWPNMKQFNPHGEIYYETAARGLVKFLGGFYERKRIPAKTNQVNKD